MTVLNYSKLPWKFEAFRKYITFEVLQQAAASLLRFENQPLFNDTALMNEFTEQVTTRTGLPWLPEREASGGVDFNLEGTIFRNKARVFSSFYIFDHQCLLNKEDLRITDFGKALGLGYLNKRQYYREIIARFEYPHPAYQDDWSIWIDSRIRLKPLIFILDIILNIYKKDNTGEVSVSEIAKYAHPAPFQCKAAEIANTIIDNREKDRKSARKRNDEVDRKISDIFGYLCITGATFYRGDNIRINLLSTHTEEQTYFWQKRNKEDCIKEIENLINYSKESI
jgi:hypothetical protein